ncbi:HAMP domain-containing protein [Candidatus Poribacteria bacterium]|nr:HAMP domain-containing protein [Candidatus Poribacteria bacterium]
MSLIKRVLSISNSLTIKLIICVVGSALVIFSVFGYINIENSRKHLESLVLTSAQGIGDIVTRSTRLSMLKNRRDELYHTIKQIGNEPGIHRIRILNKEGKITFSTDEAEMNTFVDKKAEACYACHTKEQPIARLSRPDRARIFRVNGGERLLGLIQPIENEPECFNADCHVHPESKKVLGVLDINISLAKVDDSIAEYQRNIFLNLLVIMIAISLVSAGFVWLMIYGPVKKLIMGTKRIAMGDMDYIIDAKSSDELGVLASSFNKMTRDLKKAHSEITEWTKTLEDRVENKTQELQRANQIILQAEKMASVGRLAAIVAHELNNPLSGIVAYSKLLIKRIDNNKFSENGFGKSREILDMIMNEALRCGEIVKNLLQFSRQSDLVLAPNDIRTIIHESVRLIEHLVTLRNIHLQLDLDDGIPYVNCDSQKIKQVLLALLINGCDAVVDEGVLKLGCRYIPETNFVEMTVQDNGVGMTEETARRVFEPFFTTKEEGGGVGLGLAVALSIVQRHGGSISLKSVLSEGTTFTILLPQSPRDAAIEKQEVTTDTESAA